MRSLLLQTGEFSVTAPETTPAQYALAGIVVFCLFVGSIVFYWLSKKWGLEDYQKEVRETARAQKRNRTPAMLQYPSTALQSGVSGLHSEVAGLFGKTDTPSATRTSVHGALQVVYSAVAVAWAGHVDGIPKLARRGFWVAAWVTVTGAVAVSTGAVVNLLSATPTAPSFQAVVDALVGGAHQSVDVVGTYPFAGMLWQLTYAYAILAATWVFSHWWLVATGLFVSAASLTVIERRLDDDEIPDRVIQQRRLTGLTLIGALVLVWGVGAGITVVGASLDRLLGGYGTLIPVVGLVVGSLLTIASTISDRLPVRSVWMPILVAGAFGMAFLAQEQWPEVFGFVVSLLVTARLGVWLLPVALARVRASIETVAGDNARPAAASVVLQRVLSALSVAGAGLIVLYLASGVFGGKWGTILEAYLSATAATQAGLAAVGLGVLGLGAYAVADAWPDVQAALHAAFAQKAVRAQVVRRALPGFVVFIAYVVLWMLSRHIPFSLGLALVIGLLFRQVVTLATEAAYRADGTAILKRVLRPEPMFVSWLAYELDINGTAYYLLEVNGQTLLSDDREDVVRAGVDIGTALAKSETPPSPDEDWFADFVLESGIADREDWEAKLDEKIREEIFDTLRDVHLPIVGRRSTGGRVTRDAFDRELDEFPDTRVDRRLYDQDIYPYVSVGDQFVSLQRDPYAELDSTPEWPSFSD